MSGFNAAGTLMFILAFGGTEGIFYGLGQPRVEGVMMMVGGPLLTLLDLGYRLLRRAPLISKPGKPVAGGTFLFLPVWLWGLFWLGLGAYYTTR